MNFANLHINDMYMITIHTLTGPWHVTRSNLVIDPKRNYWCIVNMLTGRSKRIGQISSRGVNYFDRAKNMAQERNEKFLKEHKNELPLYLGRHPQFDKVLSEIFMKE
jgi:hypothetical protein